MQKTENKILRGLVFDDEVSLAVLDTTKLVNDAIKARFRLISVKIL